MRRGHPGPTGPTGLLSPPGHVGYRVPGRARAGQSPPGPSCRADRVPWLIALAVFAAYATISLSRYARLAPGSWDLGIFTEYVRQVAHLHAPVVNIRGSGFNLLGDHFQPIVGLIAPVFLLVPSAATLLVVQALLTAVSVVPVSRAAAARLGAGAGRMIGAAYGLSWGLQQMIDFDFHEIAFAVPLLACSLSALLRGKVRAAAVWALPLVFVKEDQGFTVAAIGILIAVMSLARAGKDGPAARAALRCGGAAHRLGTRLVRPGPHGAHPALQHAAPVPVLGRRRGAEPRRAASVGAGGARPVRPLLPPEAPHHAAHPAAGGLPRAGLTDRAGGGAGPGAPVRVHERRLLGVGIPLQRHGDADRLHRRDRHAGQDPRVPGSAGRNRGASPGRSGRRPGAPRRSCSSSRR